MQPIIDVVLIWIRVEDNFLYQKPNEIHKFCYFSVSNRGWNISRWYHNNLLYRLRASLEDLPFKNCFNKLIYKNQKAMPLLRKQYVTIPFSRFLDMFVGLQTKGMSSSVNSFELPKVSKYLWCPWWYFTRFYILLTLLLLFNILNAIDICTNRHSSTNRANMPTNWTKSDYKLNQFVPL